MEMTIMKEHLQFARSLMGPFIDITDAFFAEPRALLILFNDWDRLASSRYYLLHKSNFASIREVEPSAFFETVAEFSEIQKNFILEAVSINLPREKQKSLKDKGSHLFVNLTAWHTLPIFAANNFVPPYLPRSQIDKFLKQKMELERPSYFGYLEEIVLFIRLQREGDMWVRPLQTFSEYLDKGAETVVLLTGIFKEACEGMQKPADTPRALPKQDSGQTSELSPSVEEFLKGLERGFA